VSTMTSLKRDAAALRRGRALCAACIISTAAASCELTASQARMRRETGDKTEQTAELRSPTQKIAEPGTHSNMATLGWCHLAPLAPWRSSRALRQP
jgi:hypothetical protein